jgi:hypothetical protein
VTVIFGDLTYIQIIPATVNVIAGTNQTFTATAYDSSNNQIFGRAFNWTTNVGTMSGSTLSAQKTSGTGYVRVTSGLVNATAQVSIVQGVLDHIELSPSAPMTVVAGTQHQFVAVGKDVFNNSIPGLSYNWSTTVGTVTGTGLYQAQTLAGVNGTVSVASGNRSQSMNVTIVPDQLTHILVTPGVVNVSAGNSVSMSATGYDQYNNSISGLTFTWRTNVGGMDGRTFTAQKATGVTGFVSATSGLVTGYGVVNVLQPAADLTWVIIMAFIVTIVGIAGIAMWRRKE